jgi:hypothetical protein
MQYLWQSHTLVALEPWEKTKVVNGEIITIDEKMVNRLLLAGFQIVETKVKKETSDKAEVKIKVKK